MPEKENGKDCNYRRLRLAAVLKISPDVAIDYRHCTLWHWALGHWLLFNKVVHSVLLHCMSARKNRISARMRIWKLTDARLSNIIIIIIIIINTALLSSYLFQFNDFYAIISFIPHTHYPIPFILLFA